MSLKNNYPTIMPSLAMDFVNCTVLSPRVTFSRSSSATRVNSSGLIETVGNNVPRFDYDPVTLAPKGLLIEESRTNLLTYSEQFDNSVWGVSGGVVAPNSTISPSGEITADTLTENVGSTDTRFAVNYSFAVDAKYALSVYAKVKTGSSPRYLMLVFNSGYAAPCGVNFDLSVGTVGTSSGATGYITQLANGWYRCSMIPNSNATGGGSLRIRMASVNTAGNITSPTPYIGDGTSGIYLWGAQLEAGTFPTSYIPTTTAQVTRAADNASMTGTNFSSWYNQSEGTVATEYDVILNTGNRIIFNIGANDTFNTTAYGVQTNTYIGLLPGSTPVTMTSTVDTTTLVNKIAAGLQTNNSTISVNTVLGTTDTACNMPASATTLTLGCSQFGGVFGNFLNGHIKSFKYYPQRLSNAQLQTLSK